MVYGMTSDEYWNGLPILACAYRKANKLRNEKINQELWLQGLYNYKAFAVVLGNSFRSKSQRPQEYFDKPIELEGKAGNEVEKEKIVDNLRSTLNALGSKFRKQGGENK